jgi:hypothetical protein
MVLRAHNLGEVTWAAEVGRGLEGALALAPGWDGYDARAVREDVAVFAYELLEQILPDQAPAPAVVPTTAGGIQLEWHEPGWELEVDIAEPGSANVHGAPRMAGVLPTLAADLSGDFDLLEGWIGRALALK